METATVPAAKTSDQLLAELQPKREELAALKAQLSTAEGERVALARAFEIEEDENLADIMARQAANHRRIARLESYTIAERELEQLFRKHGFEPQAVMIVRNAVGRSRGFGFVEVAGGIEKAGKAATVLCGIQFTRPAQSTPRYRRY